MAIDPEAQTQLARLLRDDSLRLAQPEAVRGAVDERFDVLIEGIVAEAAASDDVLDTETALSFVRLRLEVLESVLSESQSSRLFEAVREKIEAW
jgi:hypothetical protein